MPAGADSVPIPASGYRIATEYAAFDAGRLLARGVKVCKPVEPRGCKCGEVLKGTLLPPGLSPVRQILHACGAGWRMHGLK